MKVRTVLEEDGFTKHDNGKLRWSLVPWEPMADVVRVLEHGAGKYSDNNWQFCDDPRRYQDAAFRHLVAYTNGEDLDPDTKITHLAHAVCSLLFLMWLDRKG